MEQRSKYLGLYWLLFFISAGCLILAIVLKFEYLTFILPFVGTFFVKAMDII